MMAFDLARIPDKLKDAYRKNRCAVLVGAGASAGAGLPVWGTLLEKMIAEGERHLVVESGKAKEYRQLLSDPSKYLMVASGLKEDIHLYFDEFIESSFIAPKPKPTDFHRALVSLDRLQFVLTTNYDTIIERAYRSAGDEDVPVLTFKEVGELQRRLSKREFFILKAHGDAAKVGNGIILTEIDYRNILYRQRAYQSLLSAMFTMFTIVFVGASMTDPEIKLLLNYIADAFAPGSGPNHYAVMTEQDITGVEKDRWFKDLNVQLVPVSKADDYLELTEFLGALKSSV
ncbi:SIR2 family protein [Mesorhizobium sp. M1396]|uniref:SIR2 family NAD-dependent protein deacylase n=1 Tax=Mesorhizobium sp. M1396 TaxID=2957095 RepID=UPI00333CC3EC